MAAEDRCCNRDGPKIPDKMSTGQVRTTNRRIRPSPARSIPAAKEACSSIAAGSNTADNNRDKSTSRAQVCSSQGGNSTAGCNRRVGCSNPD
jgi:hypothetical protein